MHLTDFMRENREQILHRWEDFAGTLTAAVGMDSVALRDHGPMLLAAIIDKMIGRLQEVGHSDGERHERRVEMDRQAGHHTLDRIDQGFDVRQVVSEYCALRASVLELLSAAGVAPDGDELRVFHETIDQALVESAGRFAGRVDEMKDHFIGVLGHDLRNPLAAVIMTGRSLLKRCGLTNREVGSKVSRMVSGAERMKRLVDELLESARQRVGLPLKLQVGPVDLVQICEQVVEEARVTHPDREIHLRATGRPSGEWDAVRLNEVAANLVANALQHGAPETPVWIDVADGNDEAMLEVSNRGAPIAGGEVALLFQPYRQGQTGSESPANLGLGLHIVDEVVKAHGGHVEVKSANGDRTTFRVMLPHTAGLIGQLGPHQTAPPG